MKKLVMGALALAMLAPVVPALAVDDVGPDTAVAPPNLPLAPESSSFASYHGRTIDLRESWEGAQACWVDPLARTTCFDSEEEMDVFIAATFPEVAAGDRHALRANCASTVRLYDLISYGTPPPALALSLRGNVINLSLYGFDNKTTSYKIGACNSDFYSSAGAVGLYPGNTSAGTQLPNMLPGWNNVVSSIIIW